MKKWAVTLLVDASVFVEVEAETEDEAKTKAWEQAPSPSVCHQCSRDLEIGEIYEIAEAVEISE